MWKPKLRLRLLSSAPMLAAAGALSAPSDPLNILIIYNIEAHRGYNIILAFLNICDSFSSTCASKRISYISSSGLPIPGQRADIANVTVEDGEI